ncbi:MAG: metal ABC transporter substrate-binding protein [Thermomicrobiales bacterium]
MPLSHPSTPAFLLSRRNAVRAAIGMAGAFGAVSLPGQSSGTAAQATPAASRLVVAASMPLLADIVANIAGDRAEVFSIMPDTADPHTWEAAPQDMVRVTEADTFISIGHHLEPFVEAGGWRRAVKDAGIPELDVADHLDLIEIDRVIDHGDHVHDLREGDPHFWLDPLKVVEAIPAIRDHLIGLDPEGEPAYTEQAAAYAREVEVLHEELATAFAAIPDDRRVLVVFHDAFTYFAVRYDFEIVGVVMPNAEEGEVSAREMADLIETIEKYDITIVFAEPQFNTDVLSTIQAEQGVAIGELLTDSFAGRVDSYLELMRFDRESIVNALLPVQ